MFFLIVYLKGITMTNAEEGTGSHGNDKIMEQENLYTILVEGAYTIKNEFESGKFIDANIYNVCDIGSGPNNRYEIFHVKPFQPDDSIRVCTMIMDFVDKYNRKMYQAGSSEDSLEVVLELRN